MSDEDNMHPDSPGTVKVDKPGGNCRIFRHGVVETVLFMYYVAHRPAISLRNQFVFHQLSQAHGLLNATKQDKCSDTGNDSTAILEQHVEKEAAYLCVYLDLALAIPALVTIIMIGPYSDRKGRKICLFMPALGSFLGYATLAVVSWLSLPVYYLFIGGLLEGALGYSETMRLGGYAYVADTTTNEKRSSRMLLLDTIISFASATSLAVTGGTVNKFGFTYPFLCLALVQVPNMFYIIFVVPEIIAKQTGQSGCTCSELSKIKNLLWERQGYAKWSLWLLLLGFLFYIVPSMGRVLTETLYLLYPPLCWNAWRIGIYTACADIGRCSLCLVLIWFISNKLQDHWMVMIGSLSLIAGLILEAFARTSIMVYFVPVAAFGFFLGNDVYKSMLSKQVTQANRGTLFACVAIIEIVAHMSGNAFNAILGATLTLFRGFVFLVMALLVGISISILSVYICLTRRTKKYTELSVNEK